MRLTTQLFSVAVTAIFVQNLALVYMLVSDVFVSLSHTQKGWLRYSLLVTASTTLASLFAWLLNQFVLVRFGLSFLAPFTFALVVAAIGLLAEVLLRRFAPGFRKSLGAILPASVFNCAVFGLVFINVQMNTRSVFGTVFYGFCAGIGYLLALFMASCALERAAYSTPPRAFKGTPIAFITAGIMSLAFAGFMNIRIPF
jgi:electron transport complex protein RnfA